jgi:hypothetical protein
MVKVLWYAQLRKRVFSANWNQSDAWMKSLETHIYMILYNLDLWGIIIFLLIIYFFNCIEDYIEVA